MATASPYPTCHIVTPVGMLGYGLDEAETAVALQRLVATGVPTALIMDSGSTDGGPTKLALGSMTAPRTSYVRDLRKLLRIRHKFNVPLVFASAGGDGADKHVEEMLKVIEEIADEPGNESYHLKVISIFAGVEKSLVLDRLLAGKISGCGPAVPPLTEQEIEQSVAIVAQAGPEPFLQAMIANPDFNVLIGGRAYDPAPYVAYAAWKTGASLADTSSFAAQRLWGGFTHMGKIMECGGVCAVPKSPGAHATVYHDGTFDITPLNPKSKCTPVSVASHTLYEKSRPDLLHGPGGYLDLTASTYEQLADSRTVRAGGGLFKFSRDAGIPYQIKLEAARITGYRSMYMGGLKDPILLSQLDEFLSRVKAYVTFQHMDAEGAWELDFHVWGANNGDADNPPKEVFLIGEAHADTQELAVSVTATARVATIHAPYAGQKANSGNFAHGLGGVSDFQLGKCAKFSLYHLMDLGKGEEGALLREKSIRNIDHGDSPLGVQGNEPGIPLFTYEVTVVGRGVAGEHTGQELGRDDPGRHSADLEESKAISDAIEKLKEVGPPGKAAHFRPSTLGSIASLVRSKNAGPFEVTFDIMFDNEQLYQTIKQSNLLNSKLIAQLYDLPVDDIIWSGFFDQARAFKATIPRTRKGKRAANGGYMESDVHASQHYMPLAGLQLPKELLEKLPGAGS